VFLKQVREPGESAAPPTGSPQETAELSSPRNSSSEEDEDGAAAALNAEEQKPPSSIAAVAEPGGSDIAEEAQDAAVSGSDGQDAGRQERGCGRQLVPLDVPDYLRAETEDVGQGTSVSYRLGMDWQRASYCLPKLQRCVVFTCSVYSERLIRSKG